MDYHSSSIRQIADELKVNIKNGLNEIEAEKKFKRYGPNVIPSKKRLTGFIIFLNQFKSSLVYFLVIASAISFILGEGIDGWIILGAVSLSVFFGYLQESKAEHSLEALRQIIKKNTRVLRNGREEEIDVAFLVPGDVILFNEGERVSADARVISSLNLEADEASLTGESFPQEKSKDTIDVGVPVSDRKNMVYTGTVITRGYGKGIVVKTGINTEIGKIAESLREIHEGITPLQKKIKVFSKWLSIVILSIATSIFLGGILRGMSIVEISITSIAVAVASIPEGLIPAVSAILAIGMTRLLDKKALVRKLLAAETLGSTTIICSDKTGTITEGRMTVSDIFTASNGTAYSLAMKIAVLCNAARIANPRDNFREWQIIGEPTEAALLRSAADAGFSRFYFKRLSHLLDEIPFESRIRYRATLISGDKEIIDDGGKNLVFAVGAPEKILESSHYFYKDNKEVKLYISQFKEFQKEYNKRTQNGLRVLALAYKKIDGNIKSLKEIKDPVSKMVFVGFLALKDPIRPNVINALKLTQSAGIKVAIITGDHRNTAIAIAKEIGIIVEDENVLEGKNLDRISDEKLKKMVGKIHVYARILPHDKLRIVEALQARGEVVAMTGDGINDSPALKKADIGVAVGTATDVSKEASDMVLLDNNFGTIVEAVRQGRIIFDNIKKVITYVLADSFSEVILIGGSLLLGLPLPLVPAQILWTNLVEDGLPTFALAFEPGENDVMNREPTGHKAALIDKEMKVIIFIIGIVSAVLLFALFYYLLKSGSDIRHARTVIFAALGVNSLLYIFSIKSLRKSILTTGIFSNKYLVWSVAIGFLMLVSAIYLPPLQNILQTMSLNRIDWFYVLILGFIEILFIEITKWLFVSPRFNHKKSLADLS